jgi:hypothetical protein
MKTYTGGQGYVYQYYFVGKRPALAEANDRPSTEYVFDVTSDRKTMFSVSVFLDDAAVRSWGAAHGRSLNEAEQYAAAKMRLFRAFDEVEHMMEHGRRLGVDEPALEELLRNLGVD